MIWYLMLMHHSPSDHNTRFLEFLSSPNSVFRIVESDCSHIPPKLDLF